MSDAILLNPIPHIMIGTTPTITLRVPQSVDMSVIQHFYFSIEQSENPIIIKSNSDLAIDDHTVTSTLSQNDTLKLSAGEAIIQLNWTYAGSTRTGSKRYYIQIDDNSIKEVLQ